MSSPFIFDIHILWPYFDVLNWKKIKVKKPEIDEQRISIWLILSGRVPD
jgi:hypothetical protein